MALRKHSKKSWKGVGVFFQKAIDMYAERGITLEVVTPFNPGEIDSVFRAQGEAMTDAGRMSISVSNFIHMQFALEEGARQKIWSVSVPSGKWNHHPDRQAIDNSTYQSEFLGEIAIELDKINARSWEPLEAPITLGEISMYPMDHWLRLEKLGWEYRIEDFDKEAVAAQIIAESVTDKDSVGFHLGMLLNRTEMGVLQAKQNWDAYKAQHPEFEAETGVRLFK